MPSQRPKIVIYSDEKTIKKLQHIASTDRRTVSNYCDIIIQQHIADYEKEYGEIKITNSSETR